MNNDLKICLMIDFYGQMLTKKQFDILDMYYNSDYSLKEIADLLEVSRQAIYDNKKRALNIIENFEEKLKLVSRFESINVMIKKSINLIDKIDVKTLSDLDSDRIEEVKKTLLKTLNNI